MIQNRLQSPVVWAAIAAQVLSLLVTLGVIDTGLSNAVNSVLVSIMEVLVGQLRGLGYSIVPAIATLGCVCVLRIVWVYTVFELYPSVETLMWSYPISWLLAALFHVGTYLVVSRRMPRVDEPDPAPALEAMA